MSSPWNEVLEDEITEIVCRGCVVEDENGDPCEHCPGNDLIEEIIAEVANPVREFMMALEEE